MNWRLPPVTQFGLLHFFQLTAACAIFFAIGTATNFFAATIAFGAPALACVMIAAGIRIKREWLSELTLRVGAVFFVVTIPFAFFAWIYILLVLIQYWTTAGQLGESVR